MKKIMIAAAIVCAAAFAQAAAVDWTASGVIDPWTTATAGKNTPATGWAAYMVLASSLETVTTDLAAGKVDSLLSAAVGPTKEITSKGQVVSGTASGNVAAGMQSFYAIVLNSASAADATYFYVSQVATADVNAALDTLVTFGSQTTGTKPVDNWTAMAVPEPTSGLLMLLGMAGLALRRRRA